MSQSSLYQINFPVKMRMAAVMTSLLTLLAATRMGTILAQDSAVTANRRILVNCDLNENGPAGTLISRLLDHNLTLKNFRLAEPQVSPVFTVNSNDGSVCINRDDQMDFESHREFHFLVLADEDLAEQDPFLKKFSAGLLEDGLSAGAVKSLSTGTVTFDVTIQLRDVPEPPELLDANLVVKVLTDAETEFGSVVTINRQSSDELHYFIASGNEDDVFQINTDTGTLSLCGRDARHFDRISTHELVILAENQAGLSATANVVVSVVNETPQSIPTRGEATARVSEQNSAPELSGGESVSSTASDLPFELPFEFSVKPNHDVESSSPLTVIQNDQSVMQKAQSDSTPTDNVTGNATENVAIAGTDPDSAITPPAIPILNLDTMDIVEVGNWVAPTDAAGDTAAKSAGLSIATKSEALLPVLKTRSASPGILSSLVALIVFVISCVVAAVAVSRAVAARKAVLEETCVMNAGIIAANSLLLLNIESEEGTQSFQAALRSAASEADTDQNELIGKTATVYDAITGFDSEIQMKDPDASERLPVAMNSVEHSEQIFQLQAQLASRERLIAQLTKELHAIEKNATQLPTAVGDTDGRVSDDSWEDLVASVANDRQPTRNTGSLLQTTQDNESSTDVRSSLMMARERLERELTCDTRTLPACRNVDASETDLGHESTASSVATLDESQDLRSELADLFEMHAVEKKESAARLPETATDSAAAKSEQTDDASEDSHLDSVRRYLSQLLERSDDSASTEEILADRRKSPDQFRGAERRATRKPVKSFLDSYMETHGGELAGASDRSPVPVPPDKSETPPQPAKPRTPVDVKSIRESMDSFRAVAIQSVENAVLSYDRRLAKGKVAIRTMVIAGLIAVTLAVFLANMMQVIQISSLNWLMVTVVALALIELGLRIHSFRRQRKDRTAALLTPDSALHSGRRSDACDMPDE